jgi:hypothetical protein
MCRILVLLVLFALGAGAAERPGANDTARFLAGLRVSGSSPLAPQMETAAWREHAREMDKAWEGSKKRALGRAGAWACWAVPRSRSSDPCYYLFSGPDILYARTLFPNASDYVLCGTEPVGGVPDLSRMSPASLDRALRGIRRSLSTVMRFSYFITADMRSDLGGELGGTTPLICLFLARTGCSVESVERFSPGVSGVRIEFRSGWFRRQTAYYFNGDLSNGASGRVVMAFCDRMGRDGLGLLKAASYLLHEPGFSHCRQFLLSHCRVLVQDDSGLPHRAFRGGDWSLRYYGNYAGTTGGAFAKYDQRDLAECHASQSRGPLPFQLSYQWDPRKANALVAVRK